MKLQILRIFFSLPTSTLDKWNLSKNNFFDFWSDELLPGAVRKTVELSGIWNVWETICGDWITGLDMMTGSDKSVETLLFGRIEDAYNNEVLGSTKIPENVLMNICDQVIMFNTWVGYVAKTLSKLNV